MSRDPDAHQRDGMAGDLDVGDIAKLRDGLAHNKLCVGDVVVCLEKRSRNEKSLFLSRLGVICLWYARVELLQ